MVGTKTNPAERDRERRRPGRREYYLKWKEKERDGRAGSEHDSKP